MQSRKSAAIQAQTMIIITITLFALSGFMGGFAFGAFTRSNSGTMSVIAPNHDRAVHPQQIPLIPSPTLSPTQPSLGCPDVEANLSQMLADSQTSYHATVQVKDNTGNNTKKCANIALEKPLIIDGVTCKIWLSQAKDPSEDFRSDASQLQHLDQLSQPMPNEIEAGLQFDATTPQVQPCKQGQGNWKFSVSDLVRPGNYFLVGLTDWQGIRYNWSWYQLQIMNTRYSTAESSNSSDNSTTTSNPSSNTDQSINNSLSATVIATVTATQKKPTKKPTERATGE